MEYIKSTQLIDTFKSLGVTKRLLTYYNEKGYVQPSVKGAKDKYWQYSQYEAFNFYICKTAELTGHTPAETSEILNSLNDDRINKYLYSLVEELKDKRNTIEGDIYLIQDTIRGNINIGKLFAEQDTKGIKSIERYSTGLSSNDFINFFKAKKYAAVFRRNINAIGDPRLDEAEVEDLLKEIITVFQEMDKEFSAVENESINMADAIKEIVEVIIEFDDFGFDELLDWWIKNIEIMEKKNEGNDVPDEIKNLKMYLESMPDIIKLLEIKENRIPEAIHAICVKLGPKYLDNYSEK